MQKHLHRIIGVMIFSVILMSCRKDEIIEDDGCLYSDEYDKLVGDTMGKMPGMWEWIYSIGPCGIKYYITKPGCQKYQFFGSISYFVNGYRSNRQSVKYLEDKSKYIVYNREARFRSIVHSGSISIGFEHPINKRLISVIEPTFNFPFTPFKSDDTYYPYSFGVRLEIKYALF